jgi:hypothetical protein
MSETYTHCSYVSKGPVLLLDIENNKEDLDAVSYSTLLYSTPFYSTLKTITTPA